jgi:DNA-binding MarR family transcriptional regulator
MVSKWKIIGRVTYSSRKRKILQILEKPMTPTQISKITKIKLSNTSDTIRELIEMGLVEMLTPKTMRKGRIYRITRKGKDVLKII